MRGLLPQRFAQVETLGSDVYQNASLLVDDTVEDI